jgi:hypothetical protein
VNIAVIHFPSHSMNLQLIRTDFTDSTTIGQLSIDGVPFCFILEDRERGLRSGMTISEIMARKVFGQTAIPTGRYEIMLGFSERFQRQLPRLLNVPGFAGILIHNGNFAGDTEGCLLAGKSKQPDMVTSSRATMAKLMPILRKASRTQKIFIDISGNRPDIA